MDWKARPVRMWPGQFRRGPSGWHGVVRARCIKRPEVGTDIRENGSSEALRPSGPRRREPLLMLG